LTHSFRELPIEPAVVPKPWKKNKTTFEGSDHHPFVNCEIVTAGNEPHYPQQEHPSLYKLPRLRPTTAGRIAS
jgi:hypothetical protein